MKTPRTEASSNGSHRSIPQDSIDWNAALAVHGSWLRKVLRCRINDPHAVEDVAQEIAVAVFRQTARPVEPAKVAPWLYRLAIRAAINHHRRQGRLKRLIEQAQPESTSDGGDRFADALQWLIQTEQRQMLRECLSRLRAQDREILVLRYTEDWSYAQLASHLGTTLNTIEYRLARAKKRLRQLLIAAQVQGVHS